MPNVLGEAWIAIRPETVGFESQLTGAMAGPMAKAEGMFGKLGKAALVATGAVAAVGAGVAVVAVKMAGDFENLTTTLVTGAGESVANLDLIRKGVLAMAGEVGSSPADLAKGLYLIESAGFHGAAALDILRVSAEGAKVGLADQATVADAVTTALRAYNLPASDAVRVMNDLTATVALGKMHMEDLAGAMGTILPIASALGVPLSQVTGAMATMTVQGTDASLAATSLRFLMANLAGPTKAAADEMKGLGIGMDEIPGITKATSDEMKKLGLNSSAVAATLASPAGLPGALKMITDAIGKQFPAGSAQYEAALKTAVGGTRGLTAALELTGPNMATFTGNIDAITGKVTDAGGAVSGWALIQQTFNEKIDKAKGAMEAFLISFGTVMLPILGSVVSWFSDTLLPRLQDFAGWFQTNLPTIKSTISTVFGDIMTVLTPFFDAIKLVVDHFDLFLPLIVAVGGVLIGLKAGFAIAALINAYGAAVAIAGALAGGASVGFGALAIGVDGVAIGMVALTWPIIAIIAAIAGIIAIVVLVITHLDFFSKALGNVIQFFKDLPERIGQFFKDLPGRIATVVGNVIQFFKDLPGRILTALGNAAKTLEKWAGDAIHGMVTGFNAIWPTVLAWLKQLPSRILTALGDVGRWLLDAGGDALKGLWTGLVNYLPTVLKFMLELPFRILATIVGIDRWLWQKGTELLAGLWKGIVEAAPSVWKWFTDLPGNIFNLILNIDKWLWQKGLDLLRGLASGVASAWTSDVVPFFTNLPAVVENFLSTAGQWLYNTGSAIINGLWNGIKDVWNNVVDWFKGIPGDIAGFFKDALGIHSPSTVMHAVGMNVMQGLHNGLKAGIPAINATMRGLSMDVSGTARITALASRSGLMGGMSGASSSANAPAPVPTIIQNYHVGSDNQAIVEAAVRKGNRELISALQAGRR